MGDLTPARLIVFATFLAHGSTLASVTIGAAVASRRATALRSSRLRLLPITTG